MKKLVLASAFALATVCLSLAPHARAQAQDPGQVALPADQYNAYQNATTQSDPKAKAAALEGFLTTYPQTSIRKTILDQLVTAYQQAGDLPHALDASKRLLKEDPNNLKAIFFAVYIETGDCKKAVDPQTGDLKDQQPCDDAGILASKGLAVTKPADTSDPDWKNITGAAFPMFHSAMALDDVLAKKDYGAAIDEYIKELMLYPIEKTQSGPGLADTLNLAEALAKPGPKKDVIKAIWFYARAFDFAPVTPQHNYKADIELKLDYWYKRYHGTIDTDAAIKTQIDAIKAQAQSSLFPPAGFTIAPAPTPAVLAHTAYTSGDPKALSLEDKEYILANGSSEDANGLWALLKGQQSPVPGVVISAQATALKVTVTLVASPKPKDYVVKLTTPADCDKVPAVPTTVRDIQAYVLATGVKADTDAIDALSAAPAKIHKIEVEPAVSSINVAVTQDAKDSKTADFIVNMKDPASCEDVPAVGATLGLQPATELDATYATFSQIPAAGGKDASAQIVLSDGFLQLEKKSAPHKPSPAHHPAPVHHSGM